MYTVLVVEDDQKIKAIVADYMQRGGFSCITANDGIEAIIAVKTHSIDLMILDIALPDLDGFSVCQLTRQISNMPIVFLTAKGNETDKIKGFEYGADDYMTKPFSPKVLLAKVSALLRRSYANASNDAISSGTLTLIPSAKTLQLNGHSVALTHIEYQLIELFMNNPNQVFSRAQLLDKIWGFDFTGNSRTVDTHIKTLRRKLQDESNRIVTLIRSGYKFEA